MPQGPDLSLTRSDLLRHLGRDRGWKRQPGEWDERQKSDGNDIVDQGLRNFYLPPILPGERTQHEWTFLSPWASLTTVADKATYDLPEDFGGISDEITFLSDNSGPCPITLVSDAKLRRLQQGVTTLTGYPDCACIVPAPGDGSRPQIWQITFYPAPDGAYELRLRYKSNPLQIIDSAPYPLGGQPAAEALLASVLAAGESKLDDTQGVRYLEYIQKLQAAVSWDRNRNVQSLGMVRDPSTESWEHGSVPFSRNTRLYLNGELL